MATQAEDKRLFIGGLFDGVEKQDLKERFGKFGTVKDVDVRKRLDDEGIPMKVFAYVDINITENNYQKCLQLYNKTKWKGREVQIQVAKESFVDRLKREREAVAKAAKLTPDQPKNPMPTHEDVQKLQVKGVAPGTAIDGKQDWVVGKYGRPMPVVKIRRKDKKKVMKIDPSNYCHGIKKLEQPEERKSVADLTWFVEENNNEVESKKRSNSDSGERAAKQSQNVKKHKISATCEPSSNSAKKNISAKKMDNSSDSSSSSDSDSEEGKTVLSNTRKNSGTYKPKKYSLSSCDSESKITLPFIKKINSKKVKSYSSSDSDSENEARTLCDAAKQKTVFNKLNTDNDFEIVPLNTKVNGITYHSDSDSADTDELFSKSRTNSKTGSNAKFNSEKNLPAKKANKSGRDIDKKQQQKPNVMIQPSKRVSSEGSSSDSSSEESSPEEGSNTKSSSKSNINVSMESCSESSDSEDVQKSLPKAQSKIEVLPDIKSIKTVQCRQMKNSTLSQNAETEEADPYDSSDSESPADILKRLANKGPKPVSDKNEKILQGAKQIESKKAYKKSLGASKITNWLENDTTQTLNHKNELKGIAESGHQKNNYDSDEATEEVSGDLTKIKTSVKKSNAINRVLGSLAKRATCDEFYAGAEDATQGANSSDDSDEEEDLLDLISSGRTDKLQKLARELEGKMKPKKDKKTTVLSANKEKSETAMEVLSLSETKNKKSKDDKTKKTFQNKDEKHEVANQKRLETLKQRQRENQSHKNLIQKALSAVDKPENASNKKIVFESDSEDDLPPGGSSLMDTLGLVDAAPAYRTQADESSSGSESSSDEEDSSDEEKMDTTTGSEKINKKAELFESDSDDDEDAENADDVFRIRPEKEGKAGHRLMSLQSRLGGDARFKMDASFLEEDEQPQQPTEIIDEESLVSREEKEKSMAILASIVGSRVTQLAKRDKRPGFRDLTALQYDPAREGHETLEVKKDKAKKSKTKKKNKEVEEEKTGEESVPEVSKEKFFSVTTSLKDVFTQSSGFSFNFAVDSDAALDNETGKAEPIEAKKDVMYPWLQKQFAYDSSDDEGAEDGEQEESKEKTDGKTVEKKLNKTEHSGWSTQKQAFFFTETDPRIAESIAFFCQGKDTDKVREEWQEERPKLVEAYRMKRKRAIRRSNDAKKMRIQFHGKAPKSHGKHFNSAGKTRRKFL